MIHSRYILFLLIFMSANMLLAKAPDFSEKDYLNHPPRIIRTCCAFGSDLKVSMVPGYRYTQITSAGLLGTHHYLGDKSEHNGILYTRRAGFLDFGHLRDYVDWTAYLYNLAKKSQNSGQILINLGFEGGNKSLVIKVPAEVKEADLINLARRIAYDLSIWHEISSWFGASAVPLVPEKFSSFTVEDAYSNLLGTQISAEAIQSELPYEEAVTQAIRKTLSEMEAVNTDEETLQAMEDVRDIWWTRKKRLPSNKVTLERLIGVFPAVTPMLVKGWESRENSPVILKVPEWTSDGIPLSEFYSLSFSRNTKLPVRKIFPDRRNRTVTQNDFEQIIAYITGQMRKSNINYKL